MVIPGEDVVNWGIPAFSRKFQSKWNPTRGISLNQSEGMKQKASCNKCKVRSRRSPGKTVKMSENVFGTYGKERDMLWTIFVILLILWGLGLLTGYTMGGVIHALLVIAIVVVVIQVIQGRRV